MQNTFRGSPEAVQTAAMQGAFPSAPAPSPGVSIDLEVANIMATGAPGHIVIDGQDYLVAQPTESDMTAVAFEALKILRTKRQRLAMEAVKAVAGAGAEAIKAVMEVMMAGADGKSQTDAESLLAFSPSAFMEALGEPEGCAFLAWVLLRKHQPQLDLGFLRVKITDANVSGILLSLMRESRLGDLRPN